MAPPTPARGGTASEYVDGALIQAVCNAPSQRPPKRPKSLKKLNNIRRWYARMLEEFALDPRNKPAPK